VKRGPSKIDERPAALSAGSRDAAAEVTAAMSRSGALVAQVLAPAIAGAFVTLIWLTISTFGRSGSATMRTPSGRARSGSRSR
jgi:hypothetical protein